MLNFDELTIDQVHSAYKDGTLTCRQLTEGYLSKIKLLDQAGPKLNALLALNDACVTEADALDSHFATTLKFVGPLHGIPVIAKDQCDTKGIETTYGNICCKHIPTKDATLVKKLKEAGAIIIAKSTMPDFAASYNSASSISGVTKNPYCTTRETGGSSAGTGAAIAANYGIIGIGEDTGGSIRVPSSFCNLVGLRPTVGLISRSGLSPLVKTQDTPGPMTRTVRDAALTLDILVGYDPDDSYTAASVISPPPNGGSYAANLSPQVLSTARIGVLQSVFGPDTDPECSAVNSVVRAGLSRIKDSGTTLIDIEIPNLEHYLSITRVYSSRARYDVDEFLTNHPQITASTASIHASKSFHPALPLFNSLATGVSHPYEDPLYVQRLEEREEFQRIVIGIMALHNLDAIAYPSVKIPAPTIDDVLGKRFVDGFPTNTGIASQLRMPAVSVPVGFTNETGLPVGLELLGLLYREQTLLELAFGVETLMKARRSPAF